MLFYSYISSQLRQRFPVFLVDIIKLYLITVSARRKLCCFSIGMHSRLVNILYNRNVKAIKVKIYPRKCQKDPPQLIYHGEYVRMMLIGFI